jgi:type IV pilus assembly protein PilC
MPQYQYRAINNNGRVIKGNLNAANEADLEHKLNSLGLVMADCQIFKSNLWEGRQKITPQDIIILFIQLSELDRAGVPLLDALTDLRDTAENQKLKDVLAGICDAINQGQMLSEALKQYKHIFDNIVINLIAAGEKTGNMSEIFVQLAEHLKWIDELKRKIRKATLYPMFLMVVMFGVIGLMMNFVIPQLSTFLTAQGFELPFHTKALIATSKWVSTNWLLIIVFPFSTIIGLKIAAHLSDNMRYNMDLLMLSLPKIGWVLQKIQIARFCRFFAITYRSGMDILDCLEISISTIDNYALQENISYIKKDITDGQNLSSALASTNQFPSLVIRMVKVGEESGNLDSTFNTVNFFYDREVNDSVDSMIGSIQPTLTLILGGIMMWVAISVFGPLYNSLSKIGI